MSYAPWLQYYERVVGSGTSSPTSIRVLSLRKNANSARQAIVCALMRGSNEDYITGENLARTFYAPVFRSHRISVEQMGLLEPALVETLASTCVYIIRQGLDEVIKRGVPSEAARDFLLGHLRIQMAVLFDELPGAVFSDAANKALKRGLSEFIKEDWKKVFEPDNVQEQIRAITQG